MFKNPLKYQQGGQTPTQEQQKLLAAFIEWLPKRVKEFQGMQPEQIAQALDGMSKTNEGKKQLQQLMMQFQQEMQGGSQAFRQGGKIHDFICKHARGGKTGCGCKQEGGSIRPGFEYLGENVLQDRYNPNFFEVISNGYRVNGQDVAVPTRSGAYRMGVDKDNPGAWDNGQRVYTQNQFDNIRNFYENVLPDSNRVQGPKEKLAGMENGGKVLKGQYGLSSGRFDIPFGAYMKAYFNKRRTPNVGAATNRSFGYSTSNGNEYYLEDANVERNSVDTWVNVTPQKDTIIMQKLPSDHINDLEDYQMEAIMQRMRPDIKRVNSQKNGGKVEKAQRGKKVNNNRKTITEVGRGLDEYDAKEMGIDPNTLAGTSSIITAYPNKKPYVVNGQVPFWTRNGLVFDLGGVESGYIEDGTRMGKGVPGRKYKVSSVLDQDGLLNFSYNENAKEFPMISRFASPKDTIYYLDFNDFDKNTLGYEEVRSMYNKAIDQPDTFALNREAYLELQRQRQERAPKKEACGGEIKKKEPTKVRKGQAGFLNLWQSAYNSKFGKGLRNLMFGTDSDLSNEEYVKKHGYSKPIMGMPPAVKISYIPEGVYGSTRMAEQAAKAAKEAAKFKHVSPLDGGRLGHTIKDVSGVHLKNNGGKVEKAQDGQKPMYAKCGKKIKKGQFGIAGMPINPKVVKAVYDKVDNFLTPANKWEKEHGAPVIGGLGLPAYVSPVAQEIELAKVIGNRIPTQMSAEKTASYLIKAEAEKQKAIDAATKAGKIYIEPKIPADWDVDLPMINSDYKSYIPDFNNIIKFSWPEFIGRNVLLPASGVIGSAAAGSYMATKNDKNKKSENK